MRPRNLPPTPRAAVALLLFSSWLALLFAGFALHGAVHLLLAAALLLFPWDAIPSPTPPPGEEEGGTSGGEDRAG